MNEMKKRLVLGIMSGTSIDGVDYALCEIGAAGIELRAFWSARFPAALRETLRAAARGELGAIHWRRRTTTWAVFTRRARRRHEADARRWWDCTGKLFFTIRRPNIPRRSNWASRPISRNGCACRSLATFARRTWRRAGKARRLPRFSTKWFLRGAGSTSVSTIWAASATSRRWIGGEGGARAWWRSTPGRPMC